MIGLLIFSAHFPQKEMEKKSLLNDRIELKIPSEFVLISGSDEIKGNSRPDERIIFTHPSSRINVVLNYTRNRLSHDGIAEYLKQYMILLKDRYPTASWMDYGIQEINDRQIAYLEILAPGVEQSVYNLLFFTNLKERMLICTFTCTEDMLQEWRATGYEIMGSFRVHPIYVQKQDRVTIP